MSTTFERSAETEAIVRVLRGVNNEIAYQAIAKQAGLTLAQVKTALSSARYILRKEGILFGVIWGEGLKRLTDIDKANKPAQRLQRIRRAAHRELGDLNTISDFGKMPQTSQHQATIYKTVCNAIKQQAAVIVKEPKEKAAPLPIPNIESIINTRRR